MRNTIIIFSLSLLVYCCSDHQNEVIHEMSPENLKEEIIKINKPAAILEKDQIEAYLKSHQLNAKQSGTGLYYLILQEKKNEKQVVFGDQVKVNYKIYLLDGTLCYSSEKKGAKWIKVGHDNVETGVHESLQLMKAGEKGLFVMPSHLAHGLTGDQDKIPPRSPISVEIEIIEIKK